MPLFFRRFSLLTLLALLIAAMPLARPALAGSLAVTNTNDSGTGSLRAAITAANAASGPDTITFSIPAGSTITLQTALPTLTDDGTTIDAPATAGGKPGIEIKGTATANGQTVGPGLLVASSNNVIRNLIINGFQRDFSGDYITGSGISITGKDRAATNNLIEKCYIGTNAAGTAVGFGSDLNIDNNRYEGIFITEGASDNTIANNVIAGNYEYGIYLGPDPSYPSATPQTQERNVIKNNFIGVTFNGTARLRNGLGGVYIGDKSNNTTVGPGNVISGNGPASGSSSSYVNVFISGKSIDSNSLITGNRVIGNKIGTDAAGNATITNTVDGILIDKASNTTIGGANPPSSAADDRGNIISGNLNGITVRNKADVAQSVAGLVITNNWVGLNGTGNAAAANSVAGILLEKGANGVVVGPDNVVSGNGNEGIQIVENTNLGLPAQTTNNTVKNNLIGTNAAGTAAVPNVGPGMLIDGADDSLIEANRVENNGGDGILLQKSALRNRITRMTTTKNTGFGISLLGGSNNSILPPNVSNVSVDGTTPNQTLSGLANLGSTNCSAGCTLEIFQSATKEDYEGPRFLAAVTLTGSGTVPFSTPITGCDPYFTFTITDPSGNTSSFTAASSRITGCTGAPTAGSPIAQLTPATQQQPGTPGQTVTFQHTLGNIGGAGTFTLVASGLPAGWNAVVTPSSATLAANATTTVQVAVSVPAGVDGGDYTLTLTATPQGGGTPASAQDTVQVAFTPGLTFTPATQTKQAGPGQQVCYDHTLTNTGNGSDTFTIVATPPTGWPAATVQPSTPTLTKGANQTVTVCVIVPQGQAAQQYTTTVKATSNSGAKPSVTVSDVTDVLAAAVPRLSPGKQANTNPGAAVSFTHIITNVGNVNGSFNLSVEDLPAGWTATVAPQTTGVVAQNASTSVAITITPLADALAGPYTFSVRAENAANPAIFDRVVDTVVINAIPGIALSGDQASVEPPNRVVTYTLTLTNSGNFTDTITLGASASQSGWSATFASPTVTLPPRTSQPINVRLSIPPGQVAGLQNVTTVTATSSQAVFDTALITTTVAAVPEVSLLPQPGITKAAVAGQPLAFTFTLLNSGSITQTDTLTITGVPAGWSSVLTPTTAVALNPGMTATVQLVLTSPPDAPNGTANVTLQATAETAMGIVTSSVFARARIGPPYEVEIAPDRSGTQQTGLPIRYVHTVTNTGQLSDTFTLDALSNLGWDTFVTPSRVLLEPGASAVVTATLVVPRFADAGTVDTTVVTVRSQADTSVAASATDTTTVGQFAGISFSPSRSAITEPSREVKFQHLVVNLGNGPDVFTVAMTSTLGWAVTLQPTQTVTLPRGGVYPIEVRVQVPANASAAQIERIRLRAVSTTNDAISEEVQDIVSLPPVQVPPTPGRFKTYLPMTSR